MIDEGPFTDLKEKSRSPSPIRNQNTGFVEDDVTLATEMTEEGLKEKTQILQTKQRTQVLEMINDLPDADIEPPKNVLFVCKLNRITQ